MLSLCPFFSDLLTSILRCPRIFLKNLQKGNPVPQFGDMVLILSKPATVSAGDLSCWMNRVLCHLAIYSPQAEKKSPLTKIKRFISLISLTLNDVRFVDIISRFLIRIMFRLKIYLQQLNRKYTKNNIPIFSLV